MKTQDTLPKKVTDYAEYWILKNMQQRCDNPNHKSYKNYGARGITYTRRWKSFKTFLADMGERPSLRHSIERIDNNGNYTPENCKWADSYTQSMNRRVKSTNQSGNTGISYFKRTGRWRARISYYGKRKSLGYFDTPEEAADAYAKEKASYRLT